MQLLQSAAARCYKALRHPPEESCCLFCDRTFTGEGTWDDRMEHVGRHLELMRRANEQPPESKDWRPDQPMEKWLTSYAIILPHGNGWILDDQQLTQKPPRRTSSIAQLPKPVLHSAPPHPSPIAPHYAPAPTHTPGPAPGPAHNHTPIHAQATAPAPVAAPAPNPPLKFIAAPIKGHPAQTPPAPAHVQVQPKPKHTLPKAAPASTPKAQPVQVKAVRQAPAPAPATAQTASTPNGRLSSPDRLFSAFDDPADQPVKSEQSSSTSTSPGDNADGHVQMDGTTEPEVVVDRKVSTRSKAKRNAAKAQNGGGAEDDDPYLSLFQTIPKRKKDEAAGDDDDEAELESIEDFKTVAGGSQRTSRKRKASPAPSTNGFCGSLKDRIYSGFQKAVMGMATSVSSLFVAPPDEQPDGQRSTPVAKRTRTARAQEKAMTNGEDEDDSFEPVRKRQRRGRKDRIHDSAARESSTSSLSMSTRSSGRVKESMLEKGVISSRS